MSDVSLAQWNRCNLRGDTRPLEANQRADDSSASVAGRGLYPSSVRARETSKAIREVDMRAASSGIEGWRRKRVPSTVSEIAATAKERSRGTLIFGVGRPVSQASRPSNSCNVRFSPPTM